MKIRRNTILHSIVLTQLLDNVIRQKNVIFTLLLITLVAGCYETKTPVIEKGTKANIAGTFSCSNRISGKDKIITFTEHKKDIWPVTSFHYMDSNGSISNLKKLHSGMFLMQEEKEKNNKYRYVFVDFLDKQTFLILVADLMGKQDYIEHLVEKFNLKTEKSGEYIQLTGNKDDIEEFFSAHDKSLMTVVMKCERLEVSSDTPSEVAKKYYHFISNGEINKAINLLTNDDKAKFAKNGGSATLSEIHKEVTKSGGVKTIEIFDENITGDKAQVKIKMFLGNGKTIALPEQLLKEPHGWRINSLMPLISESEIVRIKVTEIMGLAAAAKTTVTEYFQATGTLPPNARAAGINTASNLSGYQKGPVVYSSTTNTVEIIYTINGKAIGKNTIDGKKVIMSATVDKKRKRLDWLCSKSTIDNKFLPKHCRSKAKQTIKTKQTTTDINIGQKNNKPTNKKRTALETALIKSFSKYKKKSHAFLKFPLKDDKCRTECAYKKGAYTPERITSVFDHHMNDPYINEDGIVLAFTGEKGKGTAANQGCYPSTTGKEFSVSGLYKGTNDGCLPKQGLNYDNHPGYDYSAKNGTKVFAAASGKVVSILNKKTKKKQRCIPKGIDKHGCDVWGFVGIDHKNGYVTQYGHLSKITIQMGAEVKKGDQIGLTGQASPPYTDEEGVYHKYSVPHPHFHFEVLKAKKGSKYGYTFVDPYGWMGKKGDDDLANLTGIKNNRLWDK